MNLPSTQPKAWEQRYETLRGHFVDNRQILEADPLGLTLLLRNGLASWMRTWQTCMETAPKIAAPTPQSLHPLTTVWQQELTLLLAHMTEQHLGPTSRL
jgi:hypothetical protein